ncbi:M1 family metallopeptidase, partial [Dyadobacter pollutisoli]
MKPYLLLFGMLLGHVAYSQIDKQIFNNVDKISSIEREVHRKKFRERKETTRLGTSENFDVKYYRTRWEVDPTVKYIKGEVTIYFQMTAAGNKVTFNLRDSLIISSIKNNNQPLSYSRENSSFEVSLPMTLQAGTLDSVSIYYEGKPPLSNFGAFEISNHITDLSSTPIMWTLSEPYGSSDWWPCKNDLTDKADSIDVYIVHPSIYKAASNGLLQSETLIQAGKTATHWKHRYPIASYLVCFAVTNYVQLTDHVTIGNSNVLMQTYCYPESTGAFQAGAQKAISAMIFFSNLFGDYPFKKEKYGHVQFEWGGGMEHQTASFMGGIDEGLIVHELAHQWFGDKVTCANWSDIWLNEGFATFLSRIYFEDKDPQNKLVYRNGVKNLITSKPDGAVIVTDDMYDLARLFDQRLSYYKGSHLLYMLRWILGDATFFTAVKNYI